MPFDIFDTYSEEYDVWFEDHQAEFQEELSRIQRAIDPAAVPMMEIGVGSGRFSERLNILYGLDPSRSLGLIAKSRGVSMIQGLGEAIPVKSGTFRTILMVTVLCFLDYPKETFNEVYRILADDGYLIIAFIEKDGIIAERYMNREDQSRFLSHARFYSLDTVTACIFQSGFTILSVDCLMGFCVISCKK